VFIVQLNVSCELCVKVASYNDRLAVWELIVEPVEFEGKHRPWEISVKVLLNLRILNVIFSLLYCRIS